MRSYLFTSFLLIAAPFTLLAQFRISGRVLDNQQKPVAGTILHLDHTQLSATSDAGGYFDLGQVRQGNYLLHCRSLNYRDTQLTVEANRSTPLILTLQPLQYLSQEVSVSATRAGRNQAMAVREVSREEIKLLNTGQDMPYILQLNPSTVITSDAGNGIGYTGIRIRGSDATRINVTVNGIPVNDAESQLVYWVNMPDFASSVENIEVVRGAGTSTNGAGAFGGSINILTQNHSDTAYFRSSAAAGSFHTLRNNISFGSGLLHHHFSLEARLSRQVSDGYIDRGSSDLRSFYLSGAYRDKKNLLRLNVFSGKEVTYQSWYGVPQSRLAGDVQGMIDYSIRNGLDEAETQNLLQSGRNYNFYTYDNQVDNYQQDHYQLLYTRQLKNNWLFNLALHGTKGRGYYEEYRKNESLRDYGFGAEVGGDSVPVFTDLIRRRWLDNWFYGLTWSTEGQLKPGLRLIAGGAANRYAGDHFGEIIWARQAGNSDIRNRYYDNNAVKDDANLFLKAEWNTGSAFTWFGDVQGRRVSYRFTGPDKAGRPAPQDIELFFFNPKAGLTWRPSSGTEAFTSVAVAHKEPNRNDFTESGPASRPGPERLIDYEAGFSYSHTRYRVGFSMFYMDYFDQLVLTGAINDVGSYTRVNIPRSYRTGLELEGGLQLNRRWMLEGNATLSDNRIRAYTEFSDTYDADFNYSGQDSKRFTNTPIAFSPSLTATAQLIWKPVRRLDLRLISRYVGPQYLDNTGDENQIMPAFTVTDFRLSWEPALRLCSSLRIDLLVNNVLNAMYASNGYTFGYVVDGSRIQENFFYPQAGTNVMGQLSVQF